jgi:trehalose-phosphatase
LSVTVRGRRITAAILDMDGVITDTASTHYEAWKEVFDGFLRERASDDGRDPEPFTLEDYLQHVDGISRYDGVRNFLADRGIELAYGDPDDPPDRRTVCGVGNRKNDRFVERIRRHGVRSYETTVELVEWLADHGVPAAVISASRNAEAVLVAADVDHLFTARVDGDEADRLELPGKPDPAVFLEAVERLGAEPAAAMVVEDALAGVEAGVRGGFGLVVGVDRGGQTYELAERGAHVVVEDLADLLPPDRRPRHPIRELPRVEDRWEALRAHLEGRTPVVFLDFDGTLSPIVDDPAAARLTDGMGSALERLRGLCTVVIVSGRDTDDVRRRVAIDGILYAGSHGFDVVWPDGAREQRGTEFLEHLDRAEESLREALAEVPGAELERKGFALAVHYRRTPPERVDEVIAAVDRIADRSSELRRTGGKKVLELRPDIDWDKGTTLLWLLDRLGLEGRAAVPVYIGDDLTDEDAFAMLDARGIGLVVQGEDDERPTLAGHRLSDVAATRRFIDGLADLVEGAS